jgi:hypothetical protein
MTCHPYTTLSVIHVKTVKNRIMPQFPSSIYRFYNIVLYRFMLFRTVVCVVQCMKLSSDICICIFNDWTMICMWLLITGL